ATEGVPYTGTVATFVDLDPSGLPGSYSATIDWGDGNMSAGAVSLIAGVLTITGANTYAEAGSYPIQVTIHDVGSTTSASTANVADAALNAAGVDVAAIQGIAFSGPVATFTDDNPTAPLSDYTATIDWGDGSVSAGVVSVVAGVLTVSGTNTY